MPYFVGEIEETFGEYEATSHFVFSTPAGGDPDAAMDQITKAFRGDESEAVGVNGNYMVGHISVRSKGYDPIPEEHFNILKLYLADLTISEKEPTGEAKETCGYCSFFEFGFCTFHMKARSPDDELCSEIKAQAAQEESPS